MMVFKWCMLRIVIIKLEMKKGMKNGVKGEI